MEKIPTKAQSIAAFLDALKQLLDRDQIRQLDIHMTGPASDKLRDLAVSAGVKEVSVNGVVGS